MITKIGIVAGEIWHFLDQRNQTTLSELAKNIEQPRDMILMSLGWLAREGHVVLRSEKDDYLLALRKETT